jgi:hypothetical protein
MTQKKNMCKRYMSLSNLYSNFVFVSTFDVDTNT